MTNGALRAPNPHDFARSFERASPVPAPPGHVSHVVVLTAPKDGAGRTTLAAHLAVAALSQGVATGLLDLDWRDRSLTRWARRRARAARGRADLVMPALLESDVRDEAGERARVPSAFEAMRRACALVVVDAPSGAGGLARDAVVRADRLVTLVPDSAAETDRLLLVDPAGNEGGRPSAYARMIWDERVERARYQAGVFDWRVIRSRSLDEALAAERFDAAERRLGAHRGPVMPEDAAWRIGFEDGLTAFDGSVADESAPWAMVRALLITLRLPGLEGARLAL